MKAQRVRQNYNYSATDFEVALQLMSVLQEKGFKLDMSADRSRMTTRKETVMGCEQAESPQSRRTGIF